MHMEEQFADLWVDPTDNPTTKQLRLQKKWMLVVIETIPGSSIIISAAVEAILGWSVTLIAVETVR